MIKCAQTTDRSDDEVPCLPIGPYVKEPMTFQQRFPLRPRRAYVVRERTPTIIFRVLEEANRDGCAGLLVSRSNPEILREDFGLKGTEILWFTDAGGEDCIRPTDIPALQRSIQSFLERRGGRTVVAIEGVEYLSGHVGPTAAAHALESLRDLVAAAGGTFVISVAAAAIEEDLTSLLDREFEPMRSSGSEVSRIIDVFVIDARSGLLMCHPAGPSKIEIDPDVMAGMLSVIIDFVKRSFAEGSDELRRFELSDKTVVIERGDRLLVAAVLSGQEPPDLRDEIRAFAARSEREYAELLEQWSGDTAEMSYLEAEAGRVFLGPGSFSWSDRTTEAI